MNQRLSKYSNKTVYLNYMILITITFSKVCSFCLLNTHFEMMHLAQTPALLSIRRDDLFMHINHYTVGEVHNLLAKRMGHIGL